MPRTGEKPQKQLAPRPRRGREGGQWVNCWKPVRPGGSRGAPRAGGAWGAVVES